MLASAAKPLVRLVDRYLPDPYIFVLILTLIVFIKDGVPDANDVLAAINLLLVLPLTTPEIVMGASLFTLFFNQNVTRGFWTIVIAHTMFCVSFVALTVKARIRGLDWSLEDAAADLGSPPLRTFAKITMPMIVPGIAAAFMLSLALSIDDYIITSFVAGSEKTFPREVFDSSRVTIPPQVHVIATMTMLVAITVIVLSTIAGYRRQRRMG